jgi:acetyl esterase
VKTDHPLAGAALGGIVLALALLTTVGFAAPAVSQPGVRIENGIVYATTEGVSLKLDAYLPTAPGPHPGVIVIYGGGWYTGSREWDQELGVELAQDGFVAFGVDYRLAPRFTYPAPVEDLQTAVIWIRAHGSEFGVDPGRLGAIGESAGGHLAALLAVLGSGARDTGSRIAAAVSLSGPMDLGRLVTDVGNTRLSDGMTGREAIEQFLGCRAAACAGPLREASPLTYVDGSDAPMLLANSTREVIPLSQATEMAGALREANVPVRLIEVPGSAHGAYSLLAPVPGSEGTVLEACIAFLRAELTPTPGPVLSPPARGHPDLGTLFPVLAAAFFIASIAAPAFLVRGARARRAGQLAPRAP